MHLHIADVVMQGCVETLYEEGLILVLANKLKIILFLFQEHIAKDLK